MTIPDRFKQAVEHLQSLELPITEEEERIADELDLDQPALLTPVQALVQAEAIKQINAIDQEEINWDNLPAD